MHATNESDLEVVQQGLVGDEPQEAHVYHFEVALRPTVFAHIEGGLVGRR